MEIAAKSETIMEIAARNAKIEHAQKINIAVMVIAAIIFLASFLTLFVPKKHKSLNRKLFAFKVISNCYLGLILTILQVVVFFFVKSSLANLLAVIVFSVINNLIMWYER